MGQYAIRRRTRKDAFGERKDHAQKFEQMQSAEQKHDEDETIAQAGTQIDDTVDALDAVLDDIESVLESNAEEYVGSFVQKGGE